MATHRIPIINGWTVPDGSGEVFFEPTDAHFTNDRYPALCLVMQDGSTQTGVYGRFEVPQNYSSAANLVIVWTSAATAGDVEFDFNYSADGGNDTESLDASADDQATTNQNDTAPSAALERMEFTIALTDGNFAAGDTVQFFFARDKADAGDTIADEVLVMELLFEYADA